MDLPPPKVPTNQSKIPSKFTQSNQRALWLIKSIDTYLQKQVTPEAASKMMAPPQPFTETAGGAGRGGGVLWAVMCPYAYNELSFSTFHPPRRAPVPRNELGDSTLLQFRTEEGT